MDDRKTSIDYVTVFFRPYTLMIYLAALSLFTHLVPLIFPAVPAKDLFVAILQSATTVLAVGIGWMLAERSERAKRNADLNIRVNAILEELYDLIEPMRLIADDNYKYAKQAMTEPLIGFVYSATMIHLNPAYQEHFRFVIPLITPAKRRNIRTISNYLENYNQLLELLRQRLQAGYTNHNAKARDYFVCAQVALKIHHCCKWMKEVDSDMLIDLESDFFKEYKAESDSMLSTFKGSKTQPGIS